MSLHSSVFKMSEIQQLAFPDWKEAFISEEFSQQK